MVLNGNKSENALNFTNWRFGGTGSGSETSDTEMNFDKTNKKYQNWSHQYLKNKEREEKVEQKYKQSVRKLRKTKKNIAKLRIQIIEENEKEEEDQDEEEEDIDIDNNDNNNNNNNKKRKRRRGNKSKKDSLNELDNSYKKWKKKQNKKGVIYISSVPFGCTSLQLKKIFNEFGQVTNVHLEAAKGENGKIKKIHNKWTEFCEGWIEFKDKKIAKQVVDLLNETKIPKKYVKNRMAKSHIWNMKYLKGFGWHHLEEYKQTIRTLQRKKFELKVADAHRQTAYFESQVRKAKEITKGLYNDKEEEDEDESNDDDGPPLKKQKVEVEQRSGRKRRNHGNKEILNKLMK